MPTQMLRSLPFTGTSPCMQTSTRIFLSLTMQLRMSAGKIIFFNLNLSFLAGNEQIHLRRKVNYQWFLTDFFVKLSVKNVDLTDFQWSCNDVEKDREEFDWVVSSYHWDLSFRWNMTQLVQFAVLNCGSTQNLPGYSPGKSSSGVPAWAGGRY